VQTILAALPPRIDGTRVNIGFPTKESEISSLQAVVSRASEAAMESTRRNQRMNQFKQLAIAVHNYADVNKHLPPAAIFDKDGRPLLSWRVAILPYIEQSDLYKQFHLDEPWDSPHNRTLIEKMPALYADPDPKLASLAGEGETTYQVPVGPETIFHDKVGTTFRDITDGTSKTILIVEVEPLRAVVWTKPEDWDVDLQNPRRGVARSDRSNFAAAFADGHVEIISPDKIDDATLRAMLTRSGREVILQP
jgi:prepilin-type processing-associated H-X9-DG protein